MPLARTERLEAMPEPVAIDYKTHILIGVRANGVMKVIAEWLHLPRQIEVQNKVDTAGDAYATFALCTPTSILTADGDGHVRGGWHRPVAAGLEEVAISGRVSAGIGRATASPGLYGRFPP
jgi:hypothetical protein